MTRTTKPKPDTTPTFTAPAIPPADVLGRLAGLKAAATPALKQQWRELFGTEPPPYNRRFLESRLAYRIQELAYGGLIGMRNLDDANKHAFTYAEAPRLLFPFARRVIADATRDAGFPPLMLEPIDFNGIYLAQLQAQQGEGAGEAAPAGEA